LDITNISPLSMTEPLNFYINVTGNENISNQLKWIFEYLFWILKKFSIDDASKVASIVWNFGDPATGVNNTSTDLSPFHDFSRWKYTVTAIVGKDGTVEVLTEQLMQRNLKKLRNQQYLCMWIWVATWFSKSFDVWSHNRF
jgi:hypothetical protein